MSSYVIQRGDTLGAIAARFQTSVSELARRNGISNMNLIHVGQRLDLPGDSLVLSAATRARSAPRPAAKPVAQVTAPSRAGGNSAQVAQRLAEEFAGYKHTLYSSTFQQGLNRMVTTIQTKNGNCAALAALAVKRFEQLGVEARGVWGHLNWRSGQGNHFWVEYKDSTTGKWKFFDPTPATYYGAKAALDPAASGWRYRDYGRRYEV